MPLSLNTCRSIFGPICLGHSIHLAAPGSTPECPSHETGHRALPLDRGLQDSHILLSWARLCLGAPSKAGQEARTQQPLLPFPRSSWPQPRDHHCSCPGLGVAGWGRGEWSSDPRQRTASTATNTPPPQPPGAQIHREPRVSCQRVGASILSEPRPGQQPQKVPSTAAKTRSKEHPHAQQAGETGDTSTHLGRGDSSSAGRRSQTHKGRD